VHFNDSTRNTSSLSYNYGNISNAYVQLQQYDDGLLYARKMMEAAQLIKRPERIQNAALQLYRAFQAKGLMDSALHYYVKADMLGDSLTNLSKTRQVMDLQTKYETVKKEVEITRLQSESSSKNKQILLLLGSSALLALLAAAMIWLYRRVQKQRRLITEQSVRLEVMMKELHHRVKNNLQIVSSLLSLQTNKLQDEGAISVLKESQLRVQAMSFIHQRLYKKDDLTAVNMKEYLTDLAELLLSTYGYDREGFDLQINANREMLDIDQALPMGLIINEMMTNSLKYAYAGVARPSLHIILTDSAQQLVCQVKDNGIGLDENKWKQKSSSFGKQLITALCKQLRAKQSLVVNAGTQFTITIPKAA
jgi:two-component sensor histidine kinase